MIPANKTVEIYDLVDEFLKEYDSVIKSHSLGEGAPKKRRNRKFTMSNSEIMTILILFHSSSFRNLKHFYLFVRTTYAEGFPTYRVLQPLRRTPTKGLYTSCYLP